MIARAIDRVREFSPADRLSDAQLADAIVEHASGMFLASTALEVDRYLSVIEQRKGSFPQSVDAAMTAAIRSMRMSGVKLDEATGVLVDRYPQHRSVIFRSAQIERLLGSSGGAAGEAVDVELPAECGPILQGTSQRRFELTGLIGRGSHGSVYRGHDRLLSSADRPAEVAVKLMPPTQETGRGFSPEAIRARRVNHQSVVRALDCGYSSELRLDYVVYDYVSGGTLAAHFERAPHLDRRARLALVRQVAEGVRVIHRVGLVHCDLKPDNILVDDEGRPQITDLGVARSVRPEHGVPASACGSWAFMAPEQIASGELSEAVDVYALGALAAWAITGAPVGGATIGAIVEFHRKRAAGDTTPAFVDRDPDLEAILRRALAHDPAHRHENAGDFAADLARWLERRPIPWRRNSPVRVTALAVRRHPLRIALASLCCLSILTGLAMWHTGQVDRARTDAWRERKTTETQYLFDLLQNQKLTEGRHERKLAMLWGMDRLTRKGLLDSSIGEERTIAELLDISLAKYDEAPPRSLDRALWGVMAGLWMVATEHPTPDAVAMLEGVQAELRDLCDPRDPWLVRCQVLRDCADVKARWLARPSDPPRLPHDAEELGLMVARFESALEFIREDDPGGAMHRVALRGLRHLVGRRLLRDRDGWDRVTEEEKKLGFG